MSVNLSYLFPVSVIGSRGVDFVVFGSVGVYHKNPTSYYFYSNAMSNKGRDTDSEQIKKVARRNMTKLNTGYFNLI